MDFVSVELKELQVAQNQCGDEDLFLCYVLCVINVAILRHRQKARCSETLEQEDRHESTIEEILVLTKVRQSSQLENSLVIDCFTLFFRVMWHLAGILSKLFQFSLLLQEIF